jgi:Protein of unknown function (DUF3768)
MVKCAALHEVATFSEFNEDNDPHREYDFGSFDLCSRTFFWKVAVPLITFVQTSCFSFTWKVERMHWNGE